MKLRHFTDLDINRSVGNLLRIGVLLSLSVSLTGFAKLFYEGFTMPKNYEDLELKNDQVFRQFWVSLTHFEGMGIIQLGILLLIFTPVVRVIFALVGYLKERDFLYVAISAIVLAIIIFSFLMGYG